VFEGEIEVDESYFGGSRKKKRGRGAAGKQAVFGLLKRKNKVFSELGCKDGYSFADYLRKSKT
jgi:transposase-like protein